jgi:hypothetical protein
MAKVKLEVAHNVSLNREGKIHKAGDIFEADRDDEIKRWLELGYVSEDKPRRKTTKRHRKS